MNGSAASGRRLIEVEYNSNNSGGHWWLSDDDWKNLEAAGWKVEWKRDSDSPWVRADGDGRWLGALATSASKMVERPEDAIEEWSRITGQSPSEEGCNCCGPPHSFNYRDDKGNYHYTSVDVVETRLSWQ